MSTTPRIGSAVAGKAAGSATIYAHEPELRELFNRMYATLSRDRSRSIAISPISRLSTSALPWRWTSFSMSMASFETAPASRGRFTHANRRLRSSFSLENGSRRLSRFATMTGVDATRS